MEIASYVATAWGLLSRPLVLIGMLLGASVLGYAAYHAAPRFGWRRSPAVLAGLGAAMALAVTLSKGRPSSLYTEGQFCSVTFTMSGTSEVLNVLMLMPFAFFAVLATRRALPVLAVSVLMSAVIEIVQTTTGQGICDSGDFFNNCVGAAMATGIAAALNASLPAANVAR